jgi:hypothetical protein
MRSAARNSPRAWKRRITSCLALLSIGCGFVLLATPALGASGTTTANVAVSSSITLSNLTSSFTLTGVPTATASQTGAVSMLVTTNNLLGYTVTVEAAGAVLAGASAGNTDSFPVNLLKVRETGGATYTSVSNTAPVTVHTQATPSAGAGDTLSNDYQVTIPAVRPDTYSVALNYTATAL